MNWKRIRNWSVGGAAIGAAVLARRSRRRSKGEIKPIPADVQHIEIVTDEREINHQGERYLSHAVYHCTPTRFRVYSLLRTGEAGKHGQTIYHVAPSMQVRRQKGSPESEFLPQERFYATLNLYVESRRDPLPDHLAKGREIEFRKCHVGGSLNGVETGERILAMAPILRYTIERGESESNSSDDSNRS